MDPESSSPRPISPVAPSDGAAVARLTGQLASLSQLYTLSICGLILITTGFILFLHRQSSVVGIELAGRTQQLVVLRKEFSGKEPILKEFVGRLQSFAGNYKDFQAVLNKHQNLVRQFNPPSVPAQPASGGGRP